MYNYQCMILEMESNSLNKLIKNLQLFFLKKLRKSNYYFKNYMEIIQAILIKVFLYLEYNIYDFFNSIYKNHEHNKS